MQYNFDGIVDSSASGFIGFVVLTMLVFLYFSLLPIAYSGTVPPKSGLFPGITVQARAEKN